MSISTFLMAHRQNVQLAWIDAAGLGLSSVAAAFAAADAELGKLAKDSRWRILSGTSTVGEVYAPDESAALAFAGELFPGDGTALKAERIQE
ncbi:MAG: hypothetical protein SF066_03840 [Thermoanaerobaculia bacterium]|nr:hypothetical protein [Thermoanaerobaculia bacterium]